MSEQAVQRRGHHVSAINMLRILMMKHQYVIIRVRMRPEAGGR